MAEKEEWCRQQEQTPDLLGLANEKGMVKAHHVSAGRKSLGVNPKYRN